MSSRANASPSGSSAGSGQPTSSTCSRISSSCAASRATFVLTMARSLSPGRAGLDRGGRGQDGLHHAGQSLGERILRELQLASCATSFSMERSSTRPRRPRSSSKPGDATTTPCGRTRRWATDHQLRGLRAGIIRVAGYAPTGSAGHAGVTASSKLTFRLDHPMQAGHFDELLPYLPLATAASEALLAMTKPARPVGSAPRRTG